MINFLVSLVIASQLVVPLSGIVLGASTMDNDFPKRKMTGSFEPMIEAASAMVVDMETGKILFQKNGFETRSIASITKLMTAYAAFRALQVHGGFQFQQRRQGVSTGSQGVAGDGVAAGGA